MPESDKKVMRRSVPFQLMPKYQLNFFILRGESYETPHTPLSVSGSLESFVPAGLLGSVRTGERLGLPQNCEQLALKESNTPSTLNGYLVVANAEHWWLVQGVHLPEQYAEKGGILYRVRAPCEWTGSLIASSPFDRKDGVPKRHTLHQEEVLAYGGLFALTAHDSRHLFTRLAQKRAELARRAAQTHHDVQSMQRQINALLYSSEIGVDAQEKQHEVVVYGCFKLS